MRRFAVKWIPVLLTGLILSVQVFAADKDVITQDGAAKVNWTKQYIEVSSKDAIPSPAEEPDRAKAYLKAKTYARMSAVAEIYAALDNIALANSKKASKQATADSQVKRKIEGFVRNVDVISDKRVMVNGEEQTSITLRAPMYGDNGIIPALIEYMIRQNDLDRNVKLYSLSVEDTPSIDAGDKGPFTSLIIDCTGLKLQKSALLRIRRPDLTDVFPLNMTRYEADKLKQIGPAVYVSSKSDAVRQRRAGSKPLHVRGRQKAGVDEMCDIVISNADADFAANENKTSKFIEKCNLIIIVEPTSTQ